MKLAVTDENAIGALTGGGFITRTLRNLVATIGAGFNLEHDTETNRHSTIRAIGSVYERGRTVAMGDWSPVPYGSVSFTASAGTWTVDAADVISLRWTVIGKTLCYNFYLDTTSIAGGPVFLLLPLPSGYTAATTVEVPFTYSDAGTFGTGIAQVLAGGTQIRLFTATIAAWTASVNLTRVSGQLQVEFA